MFKKIFKRFEKDSSLLATDWAERNSFSSVESYCKNINPQVWEETLNESFLIKKDASSILSNIPYDFGGGGNYLLIYFLIRINKFDLAVETGVAAGWSSKTILRAFSKNNNGILYSSDFPFFRIKNPEQYIGIVAKNEISSEERWVLDIRGDEIALPKIINNLNQKEVGIFHYDSDKSYSGREFAMNLFKNKISNNGVVIFDDIQDNLHFHDLVKKYNFEYNIFEFEGKYVGLITDFGAQLKSIDKMPN